MQWEEFFKLGGSAFLSALFFTVLLVPIVRRWARAWRMTAKPSEDRWASTPTPLMGGVAIGLALWAAFLGMYGLGVLGEESEKLWGLMAAVTTMGLVGLWDDRRPLAPQTKFLCQIILASIVVFWGFESQWFVSKTANRFWSILWIVAITNAFNLLDNMDGLSAGVAALACIFLLAVEAVTGSPFQPVHGIVIALFGALMGFLLYNFKPASIFMGDCGSLQVGFLLGTATTQNQMGQHGSVLPVLAVPLFIFCLPLFDMLFVAVMRTLFGRSIGRGGRDHTSHRLVAIGFSERKAVLFLYGFSAVGGLLAVLMAVHPRGSLPGAVLFTLLCAFLAMHLAQVRTYGPGEKSLLERSESLTVLWIQWTYKKRIFEVLLDLFLIAFTYWLSHVILYDRPTYEAIFPRFLRSLPIAIICCTAANFSVGLYRGMWRHTGNSDLIFHAAAVVLGVGLTVLALVFVDGFQGYSRSTFIVFGVTWLLALAGSRVSFCVLSDFLQSFARKNGQRVAIYGADDRGAVILREVLHAANHQLCPVGFIDDDVRKHNARLLGYKVLGPWQDLEDLVRRYKIQEVLVPAEILPHLPEPVSTTSGLPLDVIVRRVEIHIG